MSRLPTHRPPTPPSKMLLKEFLEEVNETVPAFADRSGIPLSMLEALIAGRLHLTPALAQRLDAATGMSAAFWEGLQANHDAWWAARQPPA